LPAGFLNSTGAGTGCDGEDDDSPANDGVSDCYNPSDDDPADGDSDEDIDFGIVPECETISGEVFVDNNLDGCHDAAAGEAPVEGVTVTLFECGPDGNPLPPSTGTPLAETVTDENGQYIFAEPCLTAGTTYYVEFDIPGGSEATSQDACGDDTESDANAEGQTECIDPSDPPSDDVDLGITPCETIAGTVFVDADNDGCMDDPGVGVEGITVELAECNDNGTTTPVGSVVTGADGTYEFGPTTEGGDLCLDPDATYQVSISGLPEGMTNSTGAAAACAGAADDSPNNDGVSECVDPEDDDPIDGDDDEHIDFGITPCEDISGEVFVDSNSNGCEDAGEAPVADVTVTLFECGPDGQPVTDGTATAVAETITDDNGQYTFAEECLTPGTLYFVEFDIPAGFSATTQDACDEPDNSDAGPDGTTECIDPSDPPSDDVDLGVTPCETIAGTVFMDDDNNGCQADAADGISGIAVELLECNADGSTTPVASTFTDADGNYEFGPTTDGGDVCLNADATYQVQISGIPAGLTFSTGDASSGCLGADDDSPNNDGTSECYDPEDDDTTDGDTDEHIDFGITPDCETISGEVFVDANLNGCEDDGEAPVAGVTVTLHECGPGGDPLAPGTAPAVATTTTDENGQYIFAEPCLEPGTSYYVEFDIPAGQEATTEDVCGDDTESDANANGQTECVDPSDDPSDDVDLGITPCESIAGTVFVDADNDGCQADAADGMPGVTIELLECVNGVPTTVVGSTVTDANGNYEFGPTTEGGDLCLDPNTTYATQIAGLPVGYSNSTGAGAGCDSSDDDSPNNDGVSECINPSDDDPDDGDDDEHVDFGIIPCETISGEVFVDANGNGCDETGEAPVADVTVTLHECGPDGNPLPAGTAPAVAETTTDEDGQYTFAEECLTPGTLYYVEFDIPAGFTATEQDACGDPSESDADADCQTECIDPSDDPSDDVDLGVTPCEDVAGEVWIDENADGCHDNGESPVAGVEVTLFECGPDGQPVPVGTNTAIATTTTDDNGQYSFADECLTPGTLYYVEFNIPAGFNATIEDACGDPNESDANDLGQTECVDPSEDPSDDIDLGITPECETVSGEVWIDDNLDGCHDNGESPMADVTVTLYECGPDGNPLPAGTAPAVATTVTDPNGQYIFAEPCLEAGTLYYVEFDIPEGRDATSQDACADPTDSDANTDGQTECVDPSDDPSDDIDLGVTPCEDIAGEVWVDSNADGCHDNGEAPVADVDVTLYECGPDGNPLPAGTAPAIATTTTDDNGQYTFEEECLTPGTLYYVEFDIPAGFQATAEDVCGDPNESDANDLGQTECVDPSDDPSDDIDLGITPCESIAGEVFMDNNGNGCEDLGEAPVPGVEVSLFECGPNGLPQPVGSNTAVATTTTDDNGQYTFEDECLTPGTLYYVEFNLPAGMNATDQDACGEPDDSDANAEGQTECVDPTDDPSDDVDLGLTPCEEISGEVFVDANNNGCDDFGEAPMPNVEVTLYECGPDGQPVPTGTNTAIATTTTDEDGQYAFDDECLTPGTLYFVEFDIPSGYVAADQNVCGDPNESDMNDEGQSECVDPSDDPSDDIDAGIVSCESISGEVFVDENANGCDDAGESPVADVTVTLYECGPDGTPSPIGSNTAVATTTTDENGQYTFADECLTPGTSYYVEFDLPAGYAATIPDECGDPNESDVNSEGQSECVDPSDDPSDDIDAGVVPCESISGEVFVDSNANGCDDEGESPMPNIEVTLYECTPDGMIAPVGTNTAVATTTTDDDGQYTFDTECLTPGTLYYVEFDIPAGYDATAQDVCGDPTESDINTDGQSECIDPSDTPSDDVDGGLVPDDLLFDLALVKSLAAGQASTIAPGDEVTFTIEVINQGTVDALNVLVNDYVPSGYTFALGNNPGWADLDANGYPDYVFDGPIAGNGGSATVNIVLTVNDPFDTGTMNLDNFAEISDAEDPTGNHPDDTDSTPDDNPINDGPVEDDDIDGTNGDEDDHDVASVGIFDLALIKTLAADQSENVQPGDDVNYEFVVTNQGTVDAYNVTITDYVPSGLSFDQANNPGWGIDANGYPFIVVAGPITADGGTETVALTLTVNNPFDPATMSAVNVGEISDAEDVDGNNPDDADSTPDTNPNNDGPAEDDDIDGTNGDEDDSDPEEVFIVEPGTFDLALDKTLADGQSSTVAPGEDVTFQLIVTNEGTIDAYNVLGNDYLPSGFTYTASLNPGWGDADADGNPDFVIAGPLAANGGEQILTITLTVNDPLLPGADLTNVAEISDAEDIDGNNPPDEDSTPDNDPNNDPEEEDDSDTEPVYIFDLALVKTLATGQNATVAPGDDVTFTIEVINQGTVDAHDVLVNDYIPSGYTFVMADNPGWGDADGNGDPDYTFAGPITAGGGTATMDIILQVSSSFDPSTMDLVNFAEIASAEDPDGNTPTDADSTPDDNPSNDGPVEDDAVDNTNDDEDDSDIAEVGVDWFDLALTKTLTVGQAGTVAPGDAVSFTITAINQGTIDAHNVLVNEYIPNGYVYDPATNNGWADADGDGNPDYTFSGPIAANGGTATATIVLTVAQPFDPATMDVTNYAEISSAEDSDGNPADDTDSTPDNDPDNDGPSENDEVDNTNDDEDDHDPETINVSENDVFDLALVKTIFSMSDTPPIAGESTVTYEIEVINQGNVNATGVEVTDYVPDCLTLADATWNSNGAGAATYTNLLTVNAGTSVSVFITFEIDECAANASVTNFAEISDDGPDGEDIDSTPDGDEDNDGPSENDATDGENGDEDDHDGETFEVPGSFDLALIKQVAVSQETPVSPGDDVTFTITVINQGNIDATNISVVDYIPSGLTLNDGNWIASSGFVTYSSGIDLAAGDQTSIEITYTVNPTYNGSTIFNYAEIASAEDGDGDPVEDIDSTPDNNSNNDGPVEDDAVNGENGDEDDHDIAEVPFETTIDVSLDKSVNKSIVYVGEQVTYSLTVSNDGPSVATGVDVVDVLPVGLANPVTINNGGIFNGSAIYWSDLIIPVGGSIDLNFTATVIQGGTITNIGEVVAHDQPDTDSEPDNGDPGEDDQDDAPVDGVQVDVELTKEVNATSANVGDQVIYTITVTNINDDANGFIYDANNVTVLEVLPAQLQLDQAVPTQGSYNPATSLWSIGTIDNGATVSLQIIATIIGTGDIVNVAQVESMDEPDSDSEPGNDDPQEDDEDEVILNGDEEGCNDINACNYQPTATVDDGTCEYGEPACADPCDAILGCTDTDACNFEPNANCDNGTCEYATCGGCTDPTACNYDANAGVDNGGCEYGDVTCPDPCDVVAGCNDPDACNFDDAANCDNGSCEYSTCSGCTDQTACNYNPLATVANVADCEYGDATCPNPCNAIKGCINPFACNFDDAATCDDGSCEFDSCSGCTDATACNFDANASVEDGSCEFGDATCPVPCNVIPGCTDATAANYNSVANCDDGSCNSPLNSLGDYVWLDEDEDGIQDPSEDGINGVTVTLYDAATGQSIGTTTTDPNGYYLFDELPDGSYYVVFGDVAGHDLTGANIGNDSFDSDADASGQSHTTTLTGGEHDGTLDAGYIAEEQPLNSIGDYVWEDTNANGVQDAVESGISGVSVTLYDDSGQQVSSTTTDPNGYYLFDNLPDGSYYVVFGDVAGYDLTTPNSGNDDLDSDAGQNGQTHTITVSGGEHDPTLDAGFVPSQDELNSLGDYVWEDADGDGIQDPNESGVNGVTVTLYDATTGQPVGSTTTDPNGYYLFDDLPDGSYYVVFGDVPGYDFTAPNNGNDGTDSDAGTNGQSHTTDLSGGEHDATIDAGIVPENNPLNSIGDYVWEDTNANGIQDAAESGISGVSVTLYDDLGQVVGSTTTDANGYYLFDNLPDGSFYVVFGDVAGYDLTTPNSGNDSLDSDANASGQTHTTTVSGGEHDPTLDAGLVPSQDNLNSIGDYVWEDTDGDGIQDPNESGVNGVTVTLYDANTGQIIGSTTTDPNGYYLFDDLPDGSYYVVFGDVPGYDFATSNNGNDNLDSDAGPNGQTPTINVSGGEHDGSIDAGLVPENNPLNSIGDYVWEDTNGNGIQDAAESGLAGVTATLYNATTGQPVGSTTTDANGYYLFDNLPDGSYYVVFSSVNGYDLTNANNGNDNLDSDANASGQTHTTTVTGGEHDPTLDAGFTPQVTTVSGCTDPTACNYNAGATVNDGSCNYGVSNCPVPCNAILGCTNPSASNYNASANCDNGSCDDDDPVYGCTDATACNYNAAATANDGSCNYGVANCPVPCNAILGCTNPSASNYNASANCDNGSCITTPDPLNSIGDYVWEDTNNNGLQDAAESGLSGVTVTLYNATTGQPVGSITTDANGYYLFDNLPDGSYYVVFGTVNGYYQSTPNNGNDNLDSDADSAGQSPITNVSGGEHDGSIDAGFVPNAVIDEPDPSICLNPTNCGTMAVCTGPTTTIEICPDWCGNEAITILDAKSTFHCSIQILPNGCIAYTPLPGMEAVGSDILTIQGLSASGACSEITVDVTIGTCITNTPPVAVDDNSTTAPNTPVTISIIGNDYDPDGDNVYICNVAGDGQPANGTVTFTATGAIYTPNAGFSGTDSFTYTICDGNGGTDTAVVTVTVPQPVNCDNTQALCLPPYGVGTVPTEICVDFCGNGMGITDLSSTFTCGLEHVNGSCFTFVPLPGFEGANQIVVTGCNNAGQCEEVIVNINVTDNCNTTQPPANNPPVANNDNASTAQNTPVNISFAGNDSDPDGDNITLCNVAGDLSPSNGTVSASATGFVYTPNAGFSGTDSFTYTICDGNGGTDQATVTVTVAGPPCNANQSLCVLTFGQNPTATEICVDFCGQGMGITNLTSDFSCGLEHANGSCFSFTPLPAFSGNNNITVTACNASGVCETALISISVAENCGGTTPTNNNPVAVDDYSSTAVNTPVNINVIGNDGDFDGDALTICGNSNPTNGTVTQTGTSFIYTPNAGFTGTDAFTYTVCDGKGGSDTATVYITVEGDTTPPVTGSIQANDDNATVSCSANGTAIDVTSNDGPAGTEIFFCSFSQPSNGSVIQSGFGFVYYPNENYSGTDSFTYTACSGGVEDAATVNITVTCGTTPPQPSTNQNPIANFDQAGVSCGQSTTIDVLANDSDPNGDVLSLCGFTQGAYGTVTQSGNNFVYAANAGFQGDDTFVYTVCDGKGGSTQTNVYTSVTCTTQPSTNNAPVANYDQVSTTCGQSVTIDVLSNDSDADGDVLSLCGFIQASYGTISQSGNSLIYTPTSNSTGTDGFTYTACDPAGASHTTNVYIETSCSGNAAPVANPDNATANCGQSVILDVLSNDSDPDGDALVVCGFTQPAYGTITQDGALLVLAPQAGYSGGDSFNYSVCDAEGGVVETSVTLNITCEDVSTIVANNDNVTTLDNAPAFISILANDSYNCTPEITILTPTTAITGSVLISDGQLVYVPQLGASGSVYIDYQICCGNDCDDATATIEVTAHGECTVDGLRVPSTVTPNGDGLNDIVEFAGCKECLIDGGEISLLIFTLNGQQVYQADQYQILEGWNGKMENGNADLPEGAYYFRIEIRDGDFVDVKEGFIELRR